MSSNYSVFELFLAFKQNHEGKWKGNIEVYGKSKKVVSKFPVFRLKYFTYLTETSRDIIPKLPIEKMLKNA